MRNHNGFTLIEVIAVLILIGILAAVAVPKFFKMTDIAEQKSLQVVLCDMNSRALVAHSKSMLNNNGYASVADQDNFSDLGLGDLAAVTDAYKDYVGTWTECTGTRITYDAANFDKAEFDIIKSGTATQPAEIRITITE